MKQHLLVVDDDPQTCAVLKTYFGRHGYEVSTASGAGEALRMASGGNFDLVLLDLLLPDGDGLGTLEKMKAGRPEVPVLIITGMGADEGLLEESLAAGAAGYVSKTLPLDELLKEAKRSMKGKP